MKALGIDIGGSSLKAAVVDDGRAVWTRQSESYTHPDADELVRALRSVLGGELGGELAPGMDVGLCVPGLLDEDRTSVTYSANLPVLAGLRLGELVGRGLETRIGSLLVMNDAHAAAVDIAHRFNLRGRLLVLALGTGVGAAVLDDGRPLCLDGDSPGHLGQIDVSLDPNPPIGPDGGAGSLEAYLGSPALVSTYGSMDRFFRTARIADASLGALARAIRIAHAIYRPNHVVLGGGTGIRLKHLVDDLKRSIELNLTKVTRPDWTLRTAEHDFHAAIGAARLAMKCP